MDCPQLPVEQSLANGQRRLNNAASVLGKDVLVRFLIYALYLLGVKRESLAKMFGYQLSGVKSIIDRVHSLGLEGLIDHRRSLTEKTKEPEITLKDRFVTIELPGPLTLRVKEDDFLARKIIGVALADEGVISVTQGAKVIGYTLQAFGRLLKRYREKGSLDLLDKRKGQQHDYKVDLEVKSEILYQFLKFTCQRLPFSSRDIHEAVNRAFPGKNISQRTIRYYLTLWGFSKVQRRLKEELFQGKKNSLPG